MKRIISLILIIITCFTVTVNAGTSYAAMINNYEVITFKNSVGQLQTIVRNRSTGEELLDIRSRGGNIYNFSSSVLIETANRSEDDVGIEIVVDSGVSFNVIGVSLNDKAQRYLKGTSKEPEQISDYDCQEGTTFDRSTYGFVVGVFTENGEIDLDGKKISSGSSSNNVPRYYDNDRPPQGNIPRLNDNDRPNDEDDRYYDDRTSNKKSSYPYVSTSGNSKTLYMGSSKSYKYTLTSGKTLKDEEGETISKNVVEFGFTDDGYLVYIVADGNEYKAYELKAGSSSSGSLIATGYNNYSVNYDSSDFITKIKVGTRTVSF